jgi:cytochrome P450
MACLARRCAAAPEASAIDSAAVSEPFAFQPLDPAFRREPWTVYARGRRERPAFEHSGLPLRVVSLFRFADVQAALRDDALFSNSFPVPRVMREQLGDDALPPPSMLGSDGAEHTRLRGLVNKAFTPRIVARLEPRLREVARELVQEALAKPEVDLVQALTYPLPVIAIAEIIGIPPEDRARFKGWSDRLVANLGLGFFGGLDVERVREQRRLRDEMHAYLIPLAEQRRRQPREDLMTGLVRAEHEGSQLSLDEMLQMLILLLVAGNETTTTLIGNTVLALLGHPEQERRARADSARVPALVEETLRWASPVQFAPRRATHRTQLHGVTLEADDIALCWIGSANRDESMFERPAEFDPDRERVPHLAFGFGPHYCLGANLARLEATLAIEALLAGTRAMEAAFADARELPIHPSPVFRGVTRLPLRLAPA